jgi:hypothetical protein
MASKTARTRQLSDGILGQHLALAVAAHLARTQLVPDPLSVYDGQHLTDMLDLIARALTKVAPVYVKDSAPGEPRELSPAELEGATVRRGATLMALKDGRTFSSVTIKRADLRQAIAILKAVGIEELRRDPRPEPPAQRPAVPEVSLKQRMEEIDLLLRAPLVPAQLERANREMVAIAREASNGRVSNYAMRLMSAVQQARGAEDLPDSARAELARLRAAIDETDSTA